MVTKENDFGDTSNEEFKGISINILHQRANEKTLELTPREYKQLNEIRKVIQDMNMEFCKEIEI